VVTIRDANLQVLRRTLVSADGTTTRLIDDTADVQPVDIGSLPAPAPVTGGNAPLNEDQLRDALQREADVDRRFTLSQIRNIPEVRALVAPVNIDAITFDTGSAAIRSDQAQQLQGLGRAIQDQIAQNPQEIFMIEGHTDTVGSDAANLALSDRRAESVALALTEYFDVPPENLVTQGYGEQFLRVRAEGDIRDNRRASVRRITDLLAQKAHPRNDEGPGIAPGPFSRPALSPRPGNRRTGDATAGRIGRRVPAVRHGCPVRRSGPGP